MIYNIPPLLLLALLLCGRKSYAWMIATALVIAIGALVVNVSDFDSNWNEFLLAQMGVFVLMIVGSMLRQTESGAWRLFFRARLHGTTDFSHGELLELLGFSSRFRRTVMNVAVIICLLTAYAAVMVDFIESGGSNAASTITLLDETPPPGYGTLDNSGMGELPGTVSADTPATSVAAPTYFRDSSLRFPRVLLPVFWPLLVGLVVAQFLLRIQDASWFRALPISELKRSPVEFPSYFWFLPVLAILMTWSEVIIAWLVTFG
ncbi:MAG: hypothetical protein CVV42_15135 [Candidatus Riflebacteria bacterium HGW-Riflebacteria-2]|jgi:hypothetical protein|nr:MAG: hypothetical protein CVV42_15135 [Candidatus Riflebacteria bacterium HGW-Riflebacteria-2]